MPGAESEAREGLLVTRGFQLECSAESGTMDMAEIPEEAIRGARF